jgi:hypothetical protein
MNAAPRIPPKKRDGSGTGPRRINGAVFDVPGASQHYGGTVKQWYARVARGMLPYRKWGGRIIFLRAELDEFFSNLPGVTPDEARNNVERRQ